MGVGNAAQQLDANGNLLNDGKYLYTYNAQNRLANVDGIYRYTYNANQQRVQKTTPQGTTLYAWANGRIIGEYDQSGTAKQETVYMGTTPIATIQQGKVYRIYADQLDTPRVITDKNGKTLWRWDSSPFGETAANEDADDDGIVLNYNPRFPRQLYDAETGLHYNYHRDYNPETGRYVQSDPIGLLGGGNTFSYVGSDPISNIDPEGLMGEDALAGWGAWMALDAAVPEPSDIAWPKWVVYGAGTAALGTLVWATSNDDASGDGQALPSVTSASKYTGPAGDDECEKLRQIKEAACNKIPALMKGRKILQIGKDIERKLKMVKHLTFAQIDARINGFTACLAARRMVTDRFFSGITDDRHTKAEDEIGNALRACLTSS